MPVIQCFKRVFFFLFLFQHKRWASAAISYQSNQILVLGGRGRFVGNSIEVLDTETGTWMNAQNGLKHAEKCYTAAKLVKPWKRRRSSWKRLNHKTYVTFSKKKRIDVVNCDLIVNSEHVSIKLNFYRTNSSTAIIASLFILQHRRWRWGWKYCCFRCRWRPLRHQQRRHNQTRNKLRLLYGNKDYPHSTLLFPIWGEGRWSERERKYVTYAGGLAG